MMKENEFREKFYKKAEDVKSMDGLKILFDEIMSEELDYGTVVLAGSAMMIASFNVVNRSNQGGMTGFQASFVAHEMIKQFMNILPPYQVLDFNKMLFPQYRDDFENTISYDTWDHLQTKAKEYIANVKEPNENVLGHWQSILKGVIPFGYKIKPKEKKDASNDVEIQ